MCMGQVMPVRHNDNPVAHGRLGASGTGGVVCCRASGVLTEGASCDELCEAKVLSGVLSGLQLSERFAVRQMFEQFVARQQQSRRLVVCSL